MASRGIQVRRHVQDDGLTMANVEDRMRDNKLQGICMALFKESGSLARLREAAQLGKAETPSFAREREFREYTWNVHGVGAEALALTIWHLAAERKWSAKKCERYRNAAEWAWNYRFDDECDDGDVAWHRVWREEDGLWRGNPATAAIVIRAVREAEWLEDQRAAAARADDAEGASSSQT